MIHLYEGKNMSQLRNLKKHLRPGKVYRRADISMRSKAVDRHLKELTKEGTLKKLSRGLYSYLKQSVFGPVPPNEKENQAYLPNDATKCDRCTNTYMKTSKLYYKDQPELYKLLAMLHASLKRL